MCVCKVISTAVVDLLLGWKKLNNGSVQRSSQRRSRWKMNTESRRLRVTKIAKATLTVLLIYLLINWLWINVTTLSNAQQFSNTDSVWHTHAICYSFSAEKPRDYVIVLKNKSWPKLWLGSRRRGQVGASTCPIEIAKNGKYAVLYRTRDNVVRGFGRKSSSRIIVLPAYV